MASDYQPKKYVDFVASAEGGQNSGVSPLLLQKNQIGFALNCSLRGGYLHPRPPIFKKNLNFGGNAALQDLVEKGFYQGGGYYRPDYGTESLIAQIAGHLIKFTENGNSWTVTDVSVPNDFNNATTNQVWMWQSENYMIVQDGTGKLPIFFNGTTSRRSLGMSQLWGTTSANFTPPAIGSTVTLTLAAPYYTGQYDVPAIINGEYYQPTKNAGGYIVYLTNVNDTPGASIPLGENVVVNPNVLAIITGGALNYFSYGGNSTFPADVSSVSNLSVGQSVTLMLKTPTSGYQATQFTIASISGNTVGFNFIAMNGSGTYSIQSSSSVAVPGGSAPSYIIGTIADSGDVAPPVNGILTAKLSAIYSGANGQPVFIHGKQYLISNPSSQPQNNQLIVINLTDTSSNPVVAPAKIMSVPELPAGRMGAYGMGRNWMSLTDGISYIAGDIVGGAAGTPANNYRDAVLKTTENDFLSGGGSFRLPGAGDLITAMVFPPILDTSLGQGELQIFTSNSCFSNNSPVDRTQWAALTSPLQTESLKDNGALAQNSTILVNSDTFFRSPAGIGSLVLARRDFGGWGNKTISNEMQRPLNKDNQTLLSYGSAVAFDNRFLSTCAPNVSAQGVFHIGIVALNFDLISSLRGDLPPSWEGVWTGVNALQTISGRVNGTKRSFAFTFNIDENKIELYEFLPEQTSEYLDNGVTPIEWVFETPILFNKDIKTQNELVQLQTGEVYLSSIKGNVTVEVQYKPDFYPCWTTWRKFSLCSDLSADNSNPTYRMRVGLGEPDVSDCEIGNNRPLRVGYFFQCRIVVTGSCVWHGLRAQATSQPLPSFAEVECEPSDCSSINCTVPDDLRVYSLAGLPPLPPPVIPAPPTPFTNNAVYYNHPCTVGSTLIYYGQLPTWIQLDVTNSRLIAASGIYAGVDQASADEQAQLAINTFGDAAVAAGTLFCFTPDTSPASCASPNTNCYGIVGYYDGLVPNPHPPAGTATTQPVFDGTFKFKLNANQCQWNSALAATGDIAFGGGIGYRCHIEFDGSNWVMFFQYVYFNFPFGTFTAWFGQKTTGSTPEGIYTNVNPGNPISLKVVKIAGTLTIGAIR